MRDLLYFFFFFDSSPSMFLGFCQFNGFRRYNGHGGTETFWFCEREKKQLIKRLMEIYSIFETYWTRLHDLRPMSISLQPLKWKQFVKIVERLHPKLSRQFQIMLWLFATISQPILGPRNPVKPTKKNIKHSYQSNIRISLNIFYFHISIYHMRWEHISQTHFE